MLFGTCFYKLQLLNYQHRQQIVSSKLARATKMVHQNSKSLAQQKRLFIQQNTPDKNQFVNDYITNQANILGGTDAQEEFVNNPNKVATARMEALTEYSNLQTRLNNEAEDMYDEESNWDIQAFKQEEEDLTAEKTFLDQMIEIVKEQIKQAEQWFKDSIQMIFGGGR